MAQKQQLVRRGAGDRDLTYAVRIGDVVRVRNGWYSTMPERSPELRAVRVGGRLTGVSAIAAWGGWVLGDHPLHVAVNENAARLRSQHNRHKRYNAAAPNGVQLHWETREQSERGTAVSVGLADALVRVILDEPFETAVAALDWAIHAGRLDTVDFESLLLRLPAERRGIREWIDPRCESLPESLARTRLRVAGYSVQSQCPMPDGRRIDLLVAGVAAVEVDGDEFHRDRFEADRAKDIDITLMGLHVLRPSARAVFRDWTHVERAVEAAIRARARPLAGAENSGHPRRPLANAPGIAGWRRSSRCRSPEFSTRERAEAARSASGQDRPG